MCDVLQGEHGKSDSSTNCTQKDERPAKKPRDCTDLQPTGNLHLPCENTDVSTTAADGENTQLVVDSATSDVSDIYPRSPPVNGRLSISNDLPESLPKSQELCLTDDNCTYRKTQQLCSESCMVSPPNSPKLLGENVERNFPQQSVNGIRDAGLLKTEYQSATMTGCRDRVTGELTSDCDDDLIIQTDGFPSLKPAVAERLVNGGSIVQDCSL